VPARELDRACGEEDEFGVKQWKRVLVLVLVGLALLLAGSFIAVDWVILLFGVQTIYAGVAKPVLSLLCLLLVLLIGKDGIDRSDTILLVIAFLFILPVDVLMSIVALSPEIGVASPAFMTGGVLSIVAHGVLLVRHGRGFPYLRSGYRRERGRAALGSFLWLPVLVFGLWALVLLPLLGPMIRIGHLLIGLVYSGLVVTSTWVAWETVRFGLYPRWNAWLVGVAMTCWFATEIVGEIYNIQIGRISDLAFNFVWIFYGTTILCLALSGYRSSACESSISG
jgi:hypothetical protein